MKLMTLAAGCAALLCSCAMNEPKGTLYTAVTIPEAATSNAGNKTGVSTAKSILNLVATGDASIEAAKLNGGITRVSSVDRKVESILGVVTYTTIVKGQ